MSNDFGVEYHLWSYANEPGELLDRLIGEVGIDHVTVPVVTGPLEHFRIAPPSPPNLFTTAGGWHFPPAAEAYRGCAVRPRTARWFGKRDVLARVATIVAKHRVRLVCRLDVRSCRPLLEHEPHLSTRNAWGDAAPGAGLCVLHPDTRELLRATVRDLRRYEPAGFQLVDWAPDLAVDRGLPRPLSHTPVAQALLDLCFCPACRQAALAAGVDPDQAARSVRQHLLDALREAPDAIRERLKQDEVLAGYVAARRTAAAAWQRELIARHADCRWYHVCDAPTPNLPWDREPPAGDTACTRIRRGLVGDTAVSGAPGPAEGRILPAWRPVVTRPDRLVRLVAEAAGRVAGPIEFAGIEEAPPDVVDWLRQALRYARR